MLRVIKDQPSADQLKAIQAASVLLRSRAGIPVAGGGGGHPYGEGVLREALKRQNITGDVSLLSPEDVDDVRDYLQNQLSKVVRRRKSSIDGRLAERNMLPLGHYSTEFGRDFWNVSVRRGLTSEEVANSLDLTVDVHYYPTKESAGGAIALTRSRTSGDLLVVLLRRTRAAARVHAAYRLFDDWYDYRPSDCFTALSAFAEHCCYEAKYVLEDVTAKGTLLLDVPMPDVPRLPPHSSEYVLNKIQLTLGDGKSCSAADPATGSEHYVNWDDPSEEDDAPALLNYFLKVKTEWLDEDLRLRGVPVLPPVVTSGTSYHEPIAGARERLRR